MIELVNTPYDDVFKTLITDGKNLIIPLINEVFQEVFSGREKIILKQNEHYINSQGGHQDSVITDSYFSIVGSEKTNEYHFECQSTPDHSMILRFFEYDAEIALRNALMTENTLEVRFPHSAVLYLRCRNNTPNELRIVVKFPKNEKEGEYTIPVIKVRNYSIQEIFEKELWFLIPFYIFNYERNMRELNRDENQRKDLLEKYEDIKKRLDDLVTEEKLDEYHKCLIIDMTNKVVIHLADKYPRVREGVESIMGGKVLEYEAKTILREGIEVGRAKGIEEGIKEGIEEGSYRTLFSLIDGNIITLEQAAEQAGISVEEFQKKIEKYKKIASL